MEQIIQIAALCVVVSLLALVLKKTSPEQGLFMVLTTAVLVVMFLGDAFGELASFLRELTEKSGVSGELFVPLYKVAGIALVVKIGAGLCADAGENALAAVVELSGTVCALLAALPLLQAGLVLLLELMR